MPDYSKYIIYVIKCKDENVEEEYVGSTTNFSKRKSHPHDLISDTCRPPLCREIRFLPAHRVVGDESADEDQRLFELILGVVDISCFCFLGLVFESCLV